VLLISKTDNAAKCKSPPKTAEFSCHIRLYCSLRYTNVWIFPGPETKRISNPAFRTNPSPTAVPVRSGRFVGNRFISDNWINRVTSRVMVSGRTDGQSLMMTFSSAYDSTKCAAAAQVTETRRCVPSPRVKAGISCMEQFPRSILVDVHARHARYSREDATRMSRVCRACWATSLFSLPPAYLIGRPAVCCSVQCCPFVRVSCRSRNSTSPTHDAADKSLASSRRYDEDVTRMPRGNCSRGISAKTVVTTR